MLVTLTKKSCLLIYALNVPNTDKKFGELINLNNIGAHIKQVDDSIHRLDQ